MDCRELVHPVQQVMILSKKGHIWYMLHHRCQEHGHSKLCHIPIHIFCLLDWMEARIWSKKAACLVYKTENLVRMVAVRFPLFWLKSPCFSLTGKSSKFSLNFLIGGNPTNTCNMLLHKALFTLNVCIYVLLTLCCQMQTLCVNNALHIKDN